MRKYGWVLLLLVAIAARADTLNFAAAFGWEGYATTDLEFSQFFDHDHTILLRFLPQYTMAGEGPMVTLTGSGNYVLGIGAFRAADKEAVKLELAVGGSEAFYVIGKPNNDGDPIPLEGDWHTLAVVRKGSTFKLFLDGKRLEKKGGGDLIPSSADLASLSGKMRFGRKSAADAPQFYGFLDDVAVFRRALSKDEMEDLFRRSRLRKPAASLDAVRVWNFDSAMPGGGALPALFNHPVTFHQPAYKALVSQEREAETDVKLLPPSFQGAVLQLPFERGVSWLVIQGNEGLLSHNDLGAFCWDFQREEPDNPVSQIVTCGTNVYAVSDGTIIDGCDLGDPDDAAHLATGCAKSASQFSDSGRLLDGYDELDFRIAHDQIALYLHLQKGSLREAFPNHANEFKSPTVAQAPLNIHVDGGTRVGRAGTSGTDANGKANNCHLHFSVGTAASTRTTFPVAFSDYEYFEKSSVRWLPMDRGIPRKGQWVRRPPAEHTVKVNENPCVCKGGFKAGPTVQAGSTACVHICRGHEKP